MDLAVVKRKKLKLGIRKMRQITAEVMSSDVDFMPTKKQTPSLVLDLYGQSDVMDGWLNAIIGRYFYFNSWPEMVVRSGAVDNAKIIYSQMDARFDVKCDLAVLHSRYGFIDYSKA